MTTAIRQMLKRKQMPRLARADLEQVLRRMLISAIETVLRKDIDLLLNEAHEQAICHRIAGYLQAKTDFNVDCEYNRHIGHPKDMLTSRGRPDIIVHVRGTDQFNLLVIEAKVGKWGWKDRDKLRELINPSGAYQYVLGAHMKIEVDAEKVIRSRKVSFEVRWFRADGYELEPDICTRKITGRLLEITKERVRARQHWSSLLGRSSR